MISSFKLITKDMVTKGIKKLKSSKAICPSEILTRLIKDSHKEKAPSNKTPALTKSKDMSIWVVLHQINSLHEGLHLKQNIQKNKVVTDKTLFFAIGPFCTHHSIYLNIDLILT